MVNVVDGYKGILDVFAKKQAKIHRESIAQDERVLGAWEAERVATLQKAARYLVGFVGKTDMAHMRAAAAPESLKEVVLRGGADVATLMMIGEGRDEFGVMMAERKKDLADVEMSLHDFVGMPRMVADRLEKKVAEYYRSFAAFEKKDLWTQEQALRFHLADHAFKEAVKAFRDFHASSAKPLQRAA